MNNYNVTSEQIKQIQKYTLDALLEVDRICRKYGLKYTLTGGSMLGAVRHHGFIPWDDDIDIALRRKDYDRFQKICRSELDKKFFLQSHKTDKEYYRLFDKLRINGTVYKETVHSSYNIHHGVYIDIFPVDATPVSKISQKLHKLEYKFFNTGLSAKYIDIIARSGKRKIAAILFRILYFPFSKEFLYNHAHATAIKYNKHPKGLNTIILSGTYVDKECFKYGMYEKYKNVEFEGHKVMAITNADYYLKRVYGNYMELPPIEKRVSHHDITELIL